MSRLHCSVLPLVHFHLENYTTYTISKYLNIIQEPEVNYTIILFVHKASLIL